MPPSALVPCRHGKGSQIFHVDVSTLKFVDRVPRKPVKAEPDTSDLMERIATVQRENLQRLDDDIAILTKYLKTRGAPKAAIDALQTLRDEQRESWKKAIEQIADLMER